METDYYVEFYESDFEATPEAFKAFLYDMHKEYCLENVDALLQLAEDLEKYEICRVISDFIKNELNKA